MQIQLADIPETRTPILDYCRHLIKEGIHPRTKLNVYRGDILALSVKTINMGAKLTVREDNDSGPYFRKYRPVPVGGISKEKKINVLPTNLPST